ncbi:MAG: hypothetical protein V4649_11840 [Bacteroidota bacterium]
MKPGNTKSNLEPAKGNVLVNLVRKIAGKISGLFEPEEVEVTFKVEGKNVTYTYTKVAHKQVA